MAGSGRRAPQVNTQAGLGLVAAHPTFAFRMMNTQQLEDVLEASKAAAQQGDGAVHLLQELAGVLETLSQLLKDVQKPDFDAEAGQQQLLLCLRTLRNACAAGAADHLAAAGMMQLVAKLLDLIGGPGLSLNWQLPQACSQLLANSVQASAACATAAWQQLFPNQLLVLAHIHAGTTQAALTLALLACCRHSASSAKALSGPGGAALLTALLCGHHRSQHQEQSNDVLGLLMCHLCLARGLLPHIWLSLSSSAPGCPGNSESQNGSINSIEPTLAHTVLLQELCSEAEMDSPGGLQAGELQGKSTPHSPQAMVFLVQLIEHWASHAKDSALSSGEQQVLQDALQLVRDVAGREDEGCGLAEGQSLVAGLQQAGCVPLLLAMLAALQPIQQSAGQQGSSGTSAAAAALGAGDTGSSGLTSELDCAVAQRAKQLPWEPPYQGYRTDILSALANLAHRRPGVQHEVQALGGVLLVLGQCQMDRQSPLAREWALWAVRNLCEGNQRAQQAIAELQLCATADSEEMRQLGVRLELDKQSGKPRVVKRS